MKENENVLKEAAALGGQSRSESVPTGERQLLRVTDPRSGGQRSARVVPEFKERQRLPSVEMLVAPEVAEFGSFYHL